MIDFKLSRLIVLAAAALLFASSAARAEGTATKPMSKKQVLVAGSGAVPISSVIRVGDLVFVSGHLGFPAGTRELAPGGIGPETQAALEGISADLAKASLSMDQVVKCTVFLADMADFPAMNEVYAKFFPKDPPTRTTVAVAGLVKKARIEVECIAAAL